MNKKMVIGTLIGAMVMFAMIASMASAGSGFAAGSTNDDGAGAVNGTNMNGDCDQTQDRDMLRDGSCSDGDQTQDQLRSQDRDMLRDGSCGECAGQATDGEGSGTGAMNQVMNGLQKHMRSMFGDAFGEYAFKYMFQGTLV
ncbi:MAG: hypothetical protein AB9860_08610 [Methanomassiliicoccales archaeon]